MNRRVTVSGWLAAALVPVAVWAAPAAAPSPLQIDADYLRYAGKAGDVEARGAVEIRWREHLVRTPALTGNIRTEQYRLPQEGHWTNAAAGIDMTMTDARYDGKAKRATLAHAEGVYDALYVRGEEAVYDDTGGGRLARGMVTTPSAMARVPDYRMEAREITISPEGKLVAYDASFYIKNWRLATVGTYRARVGKKNQRHVSFMSFLPRPIYRQHNGFGLRLTPSYPLGDRWDVVVQADWYARTGLKPDIGLRYSAPNWTATLHYGKEESVFNDDSVWVERRPELKWNTRRLYVRDGWYAGATASWGRWYEDTVRGNHFGWDVYGGADPIRLGRKWTLTPHFGVRQDRYSAGRITRNDWYYRVQADYAASDRWSWWGGVDDHHLSGVSPYRFDRWEIERAVYIGTKYQVDRLNAVGVLCRWDTAHGTLHDVDYTWYRDMHSFVGKLTYRAKQGQVRLDVWAKDF